MRKILLSGCNGRMGRCISELCADRSDMTVAAGIDLDTTKRYGYPVYANPIEYNGPADALVDFSSARQLESLLAFCVARRLPLVIATTGLSEEQAAELETAAESIPVFRSANMSLGIGLLADLAAKAAEALGPDFDIEIVERHHNQKKDAPSGTAISLLKTIQSALPRPTEPVFGRHEANRKRERTEIGVHAVRGGTIIGDHEIIFAGTGESITISHSALSRDVFAAGALRAAAFMAAGRLPGMYGMKDIFAAVPPRSAPGP